MVYMVENALWSYCSVISQLRNYEYDQLCATSFHSMQMPVIKVTQIPINPPSSILQSHMQTHTAHRAPWSTLYVWGALTQSSRATTESTTSDTQLIFSSGKQMDAQLPGRRGGWEEGWEEEEKVKIATDKAAETNIKGRGENKEKRCELEREGEREWEECRGGGRQRISRHSTGLYLIDFKCKDWC